MSDTALMNTYNPRPIAFERGEGVWLFDSDDNAYLDSVSGIAVCALGHAHPAIANVLAEQGKTLLHTSNAYHIPYQERLAKRLCDLAHMKNAFFCNSGAEANEAAIKLCRLYGNQQGFDTPNIIVMENSFHGRTMATLSASGNRKVQAGFEPLVQGFIRAPFNDIDALKHIAQHSQQVVAIMMEPIQGEGGVNLPAPGYLKALRELCDANNWLLVLDEVQTGMGRTGKMFAHQHANITPDIMTLAKALGNGYPIGACLATGKAASLFTPGSHGTTFGGSPLASRIALTVIDTLLNENLLENATRMGDYLLAKLTETYENHPQVTDIRGQGLMIGMALKTPCTEFMLKALEHKLLLNVTRGNVIRLLPPLILDLHQADLILEGIQACMDTLAV